MSRTTKNRDVFITALKKKFPKRDSITRKELKQFCEKEAFSWPHWLTSDKTYLVERATYQIPSVGNTAVEVRKPVKAPSVPVHVPDTSLQMTAVVKTAVSGIVENFIPQSMPGYVPFGNFADIRKIIKSKRFYPLYITGLSGNGKTLAVEQACAKEKRECVRVNITIETDEYDLLGGHVLLNGETVWQNGPVVTAMERGAILLLDEVDLGSNKIMCLQPVLEGKPIFLKKIGRLVAPAPGFSIIATANTKGQGSDDGKFIGTNVMNEAFLERFSVTMEQEYPRNDIETKILNNVMEAAGHQNEKFTERLVKWADLTRQAFMKGATSEIISTRRLVHICCAFDIFGGNEKKAIELCLNRFDGETKSSFLELYNKLVDDDNKPETPQPEPSKEPASDKDFPF